MSSKSNDNQSLITLGQNRKRQISKLADFTDANLETSNLEGTVFRPFDDSFIRTKKGSAMKLLNVQCAALLKRASASWSAALLVGRFWDWALSKIRRVVS